MTGGTESESSADELRERVTTLERERDEARADAEQQGKDADSWLYKSIAAEARVARLEDALTLFMRAAWLNPTMSGELVLKGWNSAQLAKAHRNACKALKALEVAVSSSDTPTPDRRDPTEAFDGGRLG